MVHRNVGGRVTVSRVWSFEWFKTVGDVVIEVQRRSVQLKLDGLELLLVDVVHTTVTLDLV